MLEVAITKFRILFLASWGITHFPQEKFQCFSQCVVVMFKLIPGSTFYCKVKLACGTPRHMMQCRSKGINIGLKIYKNNMVLKRKVSALEDT